MPGTIKISGVVLALLRGLICAALAGEPACGQGRLLLKSGFEAGVRVTEDMSDIVGVDLDSGHDWETTPAWMESSRFTYLVGKDKMLNDYMASSIETMIGPHGKETRVLRMENRADDPDRTSTSRNEYSFFTKEVPGYPGLRENDSAEDVVFREHFDYPDGLLPPRWWSEGDMGEIRNGRLYVNADTGRFRQSTIWLDSEFAGDLRVEYDVCVLASADHANNMNFFLLYSDPSGAPLYGSRQTREAGSYSGYHGLNGYIFTNVAGGDAVPARFRFRDCPGFNLVAENRGYESRQQTLYHVTMEKRGDHFTYGIDGNVVLDATDDRFNPLHDRGLMGFRTWHTELWWDNFVVTRL